MIRTSPDGEPEKAPLGILTDHLGTVRAIVDAVGALVNQTTYDSFGQVLVETNSLLGDRYKFTGRELNSGNDYYYRARTYNASQGRFGSLDQIRFEGRDANLFAYSLNSPINFSDPTGNLTAAESAVILGSATGAAVTIAGGLGCLLGQANDNNADTSREALIELVGGTLVFTAIEIALGLAALSSPVPPAVFVLGSAAVAFEVGFVTCALV